VTNPVLAVTQPDGSRKYVHPITGEIVPSITTCMKKGIPQQEWKVPWAARLAAEYILDNHISDQHKPRYVLIREAKEAHEVYAGERARIGDIVHDLVDNWMTGKPNPEPPKEARSYVNQFIDFLTTLNPVFIENETTLWSRTYGYAGTTDFIITVNGRNLLADMKTGKSLHAEIGLQLAALSHADFMLRADGTEVPLPEIHGVAGLHIRPRSWKLKEVHENEASFATFLAAKTIMEWTEETAPKVL